MTTLEDVVAGAVGGYRAPGAVVALGRASGAVEVVAVNADPAMLFEVGSITKVMTATLVLQHVERGDLQLDDPIVAHVPEFRLDPPDATPLVTVRHLLTHTSGIDCGDDFTDTGRDDDCLARYVSEAVAGSRLLGAPGERWSYCNGGYSLLGRLVEILDGRTWDDALDARVVEPLGLDATTTARLRPDQPVALGHRYDPATGSIVDEPGRMPRSAGPAGNVVATAAALIGFAHSFFALDAALIGPELVVEMVRPQVTTRGGAQALGWAVPMPGIIAHGGATRGYTAALGAVPGAGELAVLANGPGAGAITAAVQAHIFGTAAESPAPGAGDGPDVGAGACVGRYERRHVEYEVAHDGDGLVGTTTFLGPAAALFVNPTPIVLEPVGGGRFVGRRPHEDAVTAWDFLDLDDEGAPTRLLTDRLALRAAG